MLIFTPQTRRELKEVLARVFFGAPDSFFQPSNARPGEEVTLDGSIEELRLGILQVFRAPRHEQIVRHMLAVLGEIHAKFASSDVSGGRIQCHELEDLISNAPK
jgi:hypothetical protein